MPLRTGLLVAGWLVAGLESCARGRVGRTLSINARQTGAATTTDDWLIDELSLLPAHTPTTMFGV